MGSVFVGLLAFTIVRRHTRVGGEEDASSSSAPALSAGGPAHRGCAARRLDHAPRRWPVRGGDDRTRFPATGLGFGAAWAITGLVATGVTAVACQLTSSARAAGWALGTLGVLFVLRAVGDTATSDAGRSLRWISPLGWVNQVFPSALTASGSSVWAPSSAPSSWASPSPCSNAATSGPACSPAAPGGRAPRTLSGPIGLAWRLTRTPMSGWLVAMVFLGAIYGNLIANVEQMLGDPNVARILAQTAGVSVDQLTTAMAAVYSATMLRSRSASSPPRGSPSSFAWRSKSVPAEAKW